MSTITVSEKGQMVIPASLRQQLGITAGSQLEIIPEGGGFRVLVESKRKQRKAADCLGLLHYDGAPIAAEDMDVAHFAEQPK